MNHFVSKAEKRIIAQNVVQPFELEHIHALREFAPECMVLLMKNGDFPLREACRIALYGSGARKTVKGGTGSGDVNVRRFTSVEEGLENAGFTVTTKSWLDAYDEARRKAKELLYTEIMAQAKAEGKPAFLVGLGKMPREPEVDFPLTGDGDVCVYVLARNSGEGTDRKAVAGDYLMTADEIRDIRACAEAYHKFMLVLNVGGAVDISPVLDCVGNILLLSQLGSVTGDAFADVLLGKTSPSGKLTSTWIMEQDIQKLGDFAEQNDTRYREGIFVGYRLWDTMNIRPLFPFGYGLSYTDFQIKPYGVSVKDGIVSAAVSVKNIGCYQGKESVRLFYSAPKGKLHKPLRELGAFGKTRNLLPGEEETLTLSLPLKNMASWDDQCHGWILEKGEYVIWIEETPVGTLSIETDQWGQHGCTFEGKPDFADKSFDLTPIIPDDIPHIGHFNAWQADNHPLREVCEPFSLPDLSTCSDNELAIMCTGKFNTAQGLAAIIGNASYCVAGAAGETTDLLQKDGYGKLVLADGPAGLRITTSYIETPEGAQGLDAGSYQDYLPLIEGSIRQMILDQAEKAHTLAKTQPVYYHYASAIPVGTAIAQSWNEQAACVCGDIVGDEMERFGVNVWLAPALNIQRNPLCGRNFEYYSEDPFLSGKIAAAITKGVQKHPGCAVTIKHFCCNNQETNRMASNSIVSERALREIYLKGFEICIKESAPLCVMSSYNLLNGTHTANCQDLLMRILRKEWGFQGIVMTDWGTTNPALIPNAKYGASDPALCIHAGNDLIMPGSQEDVDRILAGLAAGRVSRHELLECAERIAALARRLSV